MSDSVRPQRRQPTRLPRPRDSPGKNTGVGCHFLLQCVKVKSESEVAQSCPTLSDPTDCSLPGSSIHGIFQARVLEWGAIAFSVFLVWYLEKIEEGKLYAWVSASSGKGEAFIASTHFSYLVLDKCFLKSSVQTSSCVSLTMQILIQRV